MQELRDSVAIDASPAQVWDWLCHLADHYRDWHPDHVSARWVQGPPNTVGSVMEAVERLGGRRELLRFRMTAVEPPRLFAYRLGGHASLLVPHGSFAIEPVGDGCRFTATLACRLGRVSGRLFRRRLTALRLHMREEGENLKRILEAG